MTQVLERLSIGQGEKILRSIGDSYKEVDDRLYIVEVDRVKVMFHNKGTSLKLRSSFSGSHSMSKANEWNETKNYTKSYVEDDGSIVLESDLSLEGGVTIGSIANFFSLFKISVQVFVDEVV